MEMTGSIHFHVDESVPVDLPASNPSNPATHRTPLIQSVLFVRLEIGLGAIYSVETWVKMW